MAKAKSKTTKAAHDFVELRIASFHDGLATEAQGMRLDGLAALALATDGYLRVSVGNRVVWEMNVATGEQRFVGIPAKQDDGKVSAAPAKVDATTKKAEARLKFLTDKAKALGLKVRAGRGVATPEKVATLEKMIKDKTQADLEAAWLSELAKAERDKLVAEAKSLGLKVYAGHKAETIAEMIAEEKRRVDRASKRRLSQKEVDDIAKADKPKKSRSTTPVIEATPTKKGTKKSSK